MDIENDVQFLKIKKKNYYYNSMKYLAFVNVRGYKFSIHTINLMTMNLVIKKVKKTYILLHTKDEKIFSRFFRSRFGLI